MGVVEDVEGVLLLLPSKDGFTVPLPCVQDDTLGCDTPLPGPLSFPVSPLSSSYCVCCCTLHFLPFLLWWCLFYEMIHFSFLACGLLMDGTPETEQKVHPHFQSQQFFLALILILAITVSLPRSVYSTWSPVLFTLSLASTSCLFCQIPPLSHHTSCVSSPITESPPGLFKLWFYCCQCHDH